MLLNRSTGTTVPLGGGIIRVYSSQTHLTAIQYFCDPACRYWSYNSRIRVICNNRLAVQYYAHTSTLFFLDLHAHMQQINLSVRGLPKSRWIDNNSATIASLSTRR